MGKNSFANWLHKFVVFTIIVFIVLQAFEYAVFGGFLYFSSVLMGYALPTSIVYSVLLGIVFATAQQVLNPSSVAPALRPARIAPMPRKKKSKKKAKSKKRAKKRRR